MHYQELKTCPELRPFLECVWFLRDTRASEKRAPERIVPDGCGEIIVHFAEVFAQAGPHGFRPQPRAFLMAQITRVLILQPPRTISTMGIRFRPGGLARFVDEDVHALADRKTALPALWGRPAVRFLSSLRAAPARPQALLRRVEEFFLMLLGRAPSERPDARAVVAAQLILSSRGRVNISEAARQTGVSERTLSRLFLRDVGVLPKQFARIARLQAVMQLVRRGEFADWTAIAHECEYFDQSHLVREFRLLTGEAPREFIRSQGRLSANLMDPVRLATLFGGL